MIISHEHQAYKDKWAMLGVGGQNNGAYFYSQEIIKNIIPEIRTDRNWITVNIPPYGADHSIVFVHNNNNTNNYDWLKQYKDLILVCGVPDTCDKVRHLGKPIYLPLSVDVAEIEKHKKPKKKMWAYVGRRKKRAYYNFLPHIDYIEDLPRDQLLDAMAEYRYIYAVGRCAIEAKVLGCKIFTYDERYPDPDLWQVLDNHDAAKILQDKLDIID